MAFLSRERMLALSKPLPFPSADPKAEIKEAFDKQFESSLKSIANGISVYWMHRKGEEKSIVYRYHLSPCSYVLQKPFAPVWLKQYLEELIGPKAEAPSIIKQKLLEAFPGFKSINVVDRGDWDYSIDIELCE